jgi:hypothetical protein
MEQELSPETKKELKIATGKLTLQLQRFCIDCHRHKSSGRACDAAAICPVGMARKAMTTYLRTENQVIENFEFRDLPTMPAESNLERTSLAEFLLSVHDLCNHCMFHADKCFMNIVYALIESALELEKRKPVSAKPGDFNA